MGRLIVLLFSFVLMHTSAAQVVDDGYQTKTTLQEIDSLIKHKLGYYDLYIKAVKLTADKPYLQQYYLQTALKDNPIDETLLQMAFSNYVHTNYAQAVKISNTIKKHHSNSYYLFKLAKLHLINVEVGYKICSNENLYKPMPYGQLGIGYNAASVVWYSAISYLMPKVYYGTTTQSQFYTSASKAFKRNINLTVAAHVLNYNIENSLPVADSSLLTQMQYAGAMGLSKQYKNITYKFDAFVTNMGGNIQFQFQPDITWYPLWSQQLYLQCGLTLMPQTNKAMASFSVGGKLFKNWLISGGYLYANTNYFIEQTAYLVNNAIDITKNRYTLNTSYALPNNWSCYGILQVEEKQEAFKLTNYTFGMGVLGVKKVF